MRLSPVPPALQESKKTTAGGQCELELTVDAQPFCCDDLLKSSTSCWR